MKAFRTFCLSITSEWRLLFIVLGDNFQGEERGGGLTGLTSTFAYRLALLSILSHCVNPDQITALINISSEKELTFELELFYFALNIPTCKTGVCDVHSLSLSGLTDLDLPYTARLE